MTFISLPIGSLTFDKNNLLTRRKLKVEDAARFGVSGLVFGKIYRSARRSGLSRRKARKLANRKRRNFVDNIIMHHKRLHDYNRKLVVSSARDRAIARRKKLEVRDQNKDRLEHQRQEKQQQRWSEKENIKQKSLEIRQRIETKRIRSQSRWAALIENRSEN